MNNNRDRELKHKKQSYWIVSTAILLATTIALVQPMNAWSQDVGATGILVNNCTLAVQPDDGIDMNTVVGNRGSIEIAKTIHREKQIFECEDLNNPSTTYIVEVAIFAEIAGNIDTKSIMRKQAEAITCLKDPTDGTVIECQKRFPTKQSIPVSNCEEQF